MEGVLCSTRAVVTEICLATGVMEEECLRCLLSWLLVLGLCSPEIRELESKLRAGYMNKERAVQLLEKEAIREQEKVAPRHILC